MAEGYEFDLTYVTERIIAVFFHRTCSAQAYLHNLQEITHMLKSKHADNYLVINLSEPRTDLRRMNLRVLEFGWPQFHAPSLNLLCSVCKNMHDWLNTHTQHVLILHCQGDRGRVGVVISSYIHIPSVSANEENALDLFTMRQFCQEESANRMTPSQNRCVQMIAGLMTGQIRINHSSLFLHCVALHRVPNFHPTVCQLFIRVYQNMQAVYTSAIHQVAVGQADTVYFCMEPPQSLRGDIMIVCYHKNAAAGKREVVFRVQFHSGTLTGQPLSFHKKDLDHAKTDPRFPEDGRVDLVFTEAGRTNPDVSSAPAPWLNSSAVVIDYDTQDSLVRRDSYENLTTEVQHDQSPTHVPLNAEQPRLTQLSVTTSSASVVHDPVTTKPWSEHCIRSVSSASGFSSTPQWEEGQKTLLQTGDSLVQSHRPRPLDQLDRDLPPLEGTMTELTVANQNVEQETEEGSQHSDTTHGHVICNNHVNGEATPTEQKTEVLDKEVAMTSNSKDTPSARNLPASLSLDGSGSHQNCSQSEDPGRCYAASETSGQEVTLTSVHTYRTVTRTYKTDTPVSQERPDPAHSNIYHTPERLGQRNEAVLHGHSVTQLTNQVPQLESEAEKEEELASLASDIDQSIEQLNQLILDLDPEFEPVPTRARGHMTRSASLQTNGIHCVDGQRNTAQSGWKHRQVSDVTDYSGISPYQNPPVHTPLSQRRGLYRYETVDCGDVSPVIDGRSYEAPATPAFPVSPPTPYVKSASDFSHLKLTSKPSDQFLGKTWQESRGYIDSMTHTPVSSDGDLFRSDVTASPASCQRMFGSMRSLSTSSPQLPNDSPTPPQSWLKGGSSTPLSHYTPQSSPSLTAPNSHSSPRGPPRGVPDSLELTLMEAVEGLEMLGLGGTHPPLLPQKRRGVDGADVSLTPPLSRSGVSSVPFSSSNSSPTGSAPSPDWTSNKQETVKFVQDTSKFWYKPDISREQAIAVLKDKKPGSFIVRDSHSFRGAYGLAMKVATPPPSVLQQSRKGGDLSSELVRHFLIECTQKGVRLKGCPNEPYFGSLTALVCQHSITPLALPCKLILPDKDPLEELSESQAQSSSNSAAELLKQGAACNVWFLGCVDLECLTGLQAVQKASSIILCSQPPPASTIVHFKVSSQGITLTDNQRKLFFRRHYPVSTVIFCALDPQDRKWVKDGCSPAKIFGFVARKSTNSTENVCHVFAEHDPEQPASAIVNFVSKVMIGSQKSK
ncbi:tensin 3-2 [Chanos chanos]|uniref:Tensin 3-2 n=1 Tax=Chanos chanos TaxID=29144 RepID=A0A6J2V5Y7_CHACN|nr:tensin-3-like [Chanos chanos]